MRLPLFFSFLFLSARLLAQDPVLIDGAQVFGLCYGDNMDSSVTYVCTTGEACVINVCAGQLEVCCDELIVYDGVDIMAPILFEGNNNGDMTGLVAMSSNPDHALTCRIVTNGSVNCGSEGYVPLIWSVSCGVPVDCSVGIHEELRTELSLYPDPSEGLLRVTLPVDFGGSVQVAVVDVSGRQVFQQAFAADALREAPLDLNELDAGEYFLRVVSGGRMMARPFVIAR